jgi:serine/threonine protein kinase
VLRFGVMRKTEVIPRIKVPPRAHGEQTRSGDADTSEAATINLPPPGTGSPASPDIKGKDTGRAGLLADHYVSIEKIGEGGMGVVYLARDPQLGRYVAVKRLKKKVAGRKAMRDRFLQEAKTAAVLNHIHIVHVYALGEDKAGPYIVMEYVAGPPQEGAPAHIPSPPFSLADRVHRDGPLPLQEAIALILKVAGAMEYAHGCGVIHRDLKPSNVLLDESGEPKLADFGLARLTQPDQKPLTVPGEKMLSLGYGAPEQEHDASQTDERADIYGLGGLLYFSITGQNPRYFRRQDVPDAIQAPLDKALATDREKRWQRVREFREALLLVQAPSTVELPTVKTTWRCKWCDTINPIDIQYCGQCGWDGGENCLECGADKRVGIQFCGACGADAREYEEAAHTLERLKQDLEDKRYEHIEDHAERINGFVPIGPNGRKLVTKVNQIRERAALAARRLNDLRSLIPMELGAQNYERAQRFIEEYDTLTDDARFADESKRLKTLTVDRDLERARRAMRDQEWAYAARICRIILQKTSPKDPRTRALLRRIQRRRWTRRLALLVSTAAVLVLAYGLTAAPAYKFMRDAAGPMLDRVYSPELWLYREGTIRAVQERYASLWGMDDLYLRRDPTSVMDPPEALPAVPGAERLVQLRNDFEKQVVRIRVEYDLQVNAWPHQYERALTELQTELQLAGSYEGWESVKYELERFQDNPVIRDQDRLPQIPRLHAIQVDFQNRLSTYRTEKQNLIASAVATYIETLSQLIKHVTQQGKMQAAQTYNAEIKRVQTIPEYVDSQRDVARRAETEAMRASTSNAWLSTPDEL